MWPGTRPSGHACYELAVCAIPVHIAPGSTAPIVSQGSDLIDFDQSSRGPLFIRLHDSVGGLVPLGREHRFSRQKVFGVTVCDI